MSLFSYLSWMSIYFQSFSIKFEAFCIFVAVSILILQIHCTVMLLKSYIAIFLRVDISTFLQACNNITETFRNFHAILQCFNVKFMQYFCNLSMLYGRTPKSRFLGRVVHTTHDVTVAQ